jgi:Cytochrome c554 and c-prime
MRRLRGLVLLAAACGLALASAAWFFLASRASVQSARDPRREYSGPLRNVDPSVRYVSDDRCAECHTDQATSFAEQSMAHSLLPVSRASAPPLDGRHNNPFQALGWQFVVEQQGDRVWHRRTPVEKPKPASGPQRPQGPGEEDPIADLAQSWQVDYALGSGTHGYAYLAARNGYLYETPISWYSERAGAGSPAAGSRSASHRSIEGTWDLSPGFGPPVLTGRTISAECLFCHANRAHPVEGSINRYQEPVFDGYAIGCQRCHGPGELHVACRERSEPVTGPVDVTIVNPRHLEPRVRDAVCEQCHLQARARILHRPWGLYDYRPGLPMKLFWSVFVSAPGGKGAAKAVGHVEQMHESRCFQASAGPDQLGCISCHDPHEHLPPDRKVAYYRNQCLKCHTPQSCSLAAAERLKQTPQDSCIDCHMPRYNTSDIPHAASTDHRILRNPQAQKSAARSDQSAAGGTKSEDKGQKNPARSFDPRSVLVSFFDDPQANEDEIDRDRGLALVTLARSGNAASAGVLPEVLSILEAAGQRDPADLAVGEAKAYALAIMKRWSEAQEAFAAVLAAGPERESALLGAATAAEQLENGKLAESYWRRAIVANPWEPGYRRHLVLLLARRRAWAEAEPDCDAWVRLDPLSAEARTARLQCLLAAGKQEDAQREFARIELLNPANLRELELRFERKLKLR